MIVQFENPPSVEALAELAARGAKVLQDVPDNAVLVLMDARVGLDGLGVTYAEAIDAEDKVSPLIGNAKYTTGYYLVEFHPDVDLNFARALILNASVGLREHPDLGPRQLLVQVKNSKQGLDALVALADRDEVAYVFPASQDLVAGTPVFRCAGALTLNGPLGQYVATVGDGWDGPGKNATTLSYFFSQMTARLPTGAPQSEILRAMAEWSKVIQLTWQARIELHRDPYRERAVRRWRPRRWLSL
jgi:hypothetical protein